MEVDLRGRRGEESRSQVERYLNEAYLARLPWVRIIHGKGTGALRDAIREDLKHNDLVTEARAGGPGEGGDGVTVVKLIDSQ
jgi:DNA mismatch repair protein MutS2